LKQGHTKLIFVFRLFGSTYFTFTKILLQKMAHEFGLSTEGHNRLDARLVAIREAYDATQEIPQAYPTPQAQEEDRTSFVDAAIQGLTDFWGTLGGLFSSNAVNQRVNPSYEGEVEMRVVYDDNGDEWIKIIITNDMEELVQMSGSGGTIAPSSVSTQRTRSTSHRTLPLHHLPHIRRGNLRRSMSEGFLSAWRADTRREVNRLMDQAADEITANLYLPIPPFTQVC
jgi:hypothetical protein